MLPKQDQAQNRAGGASDRPGNKSNKRPADGPLASSSTKKPKTQDGYPGPKGKNKSSNSSGSRTDASTRRQNSGKHSQGKNLNHDQPRPNKSSAASKSSIGSQAHSRDQRRFKPWETRTIAAQYSDAALKDGELDVQGFLNARGFEIKALDESMRRTRTSGHSRAFQQVPFTMRRRAAAHDYKRVPKRLHRKAQREMQIDNTPTVNAKTRKPKTTRARLRAETALRLGKLAERKRRQKLLKKGKEGKLNEQTIATRMARPKVKRNTLNQPAVMNPKFRKRQLHKTWLPTHLWHAKRARMTDPKEPLWRFAIPLTPTQKFYRPTHRAQWEKGALAWDMSYMSTIGLCGATKSVEHALRALGLTAESLWSQRGERWRSGAVHWNGSLRRKQDDILRTIGPATIFWNPESQLGTTEGAQEQGITRRLFLRLHPSIFLETFNELLRTTKGLTPRPYIEDLRYEIGSIDITGPSSTEALQGLLYPYHDKPETKEPHAQKFESLAGLSGPTTLPLGSLLAFSIMDPRLRYPPRRVNQPGTTDQVARSSLMQTVSTWHKDEDLAPYALFDRDARFRASRLPSQKSLNRRRGKKGPGALLELTEADPGIPIIMLAQRHSTTTGTWTLMMPWKCILPTWYGLTHYPLSSGGNPGFGGLNEIKQLAFEQGIPWFPGDFPASVAGMSWELEQRLVRKKAWDRMPNGKRVNYDTLDLGAGRKGEIGDGWSCDYETLLGLEPLVTSMEKPDAEMDDRGTEEGELVQKPEKQVTGNSKHPLTRLTQISKLALDAFFLPKATPLPPTALVTVKITFLSRGVPDPCARVYRLPATKPVLTSTPAEVPEEDPPLTKNTGTPSNLGVQWLATLPKKGKAARPNPGLKHNSAANIDLEARKRLLAQELTTPYRPSAKDGGINGHLPCPDAEDLIGFVTTGSFNLRNGRAEAIASLSAQKALEESRRYRNKTDAATRVCVVRNAGQNIGWIARWELV
ncbi:ribonucleases P/MRP protein subunit POP1-domain-containing protein [Xylariales sp. AK1849]|nr:ribonucleases P/MRP protein subunit POP1-domain-containing protein [Xylariales sp. AK1849]